MLLKVMQPELLQMRYLLSVVIVIPSLCSHMLHYGCNLFSVSFLGKSMPCHKKDFIFHHHAVVLILVWEEDIVIRLV